MKGSATLGVLAVVGIAGGGVAWWLWRHRESIDVAGSDPDAPDEGDDETGDETGPTEDDLEGLARALASEADFGEYSEAERQAIAWCARNEVARRRTTMAALMLPPHHQRGHWCSTFQSPGESDTQLARRVLAGETADPTHGAHSFYEPAEQDREQAAGKVSLTADDINTRWTAPRGATVVLSDGKSYSGDGMQLLATIGRWRFYG